MRAKTGHRWAILVVLGSTLGLATVHSTVAEAQGGPERGGPKRFDCIGYQDRDFRGSYISQNRGRGWSYVGSSWNDKVSSFRMASGCYITAYQHKDYQGDSRVFRGDYRYVGDLWNDQISSWKCSCN